MREETSAALDNRYRRRRALILIAGALLVQSAYPQTASIRKDSFETGTIQSSIWNASDTDGCSASVQTGDAADGTHYLRSTLTAKAGGGNYRCELNAKGIGMQTTDIDGDHALLRNFLSDASSHARTIRRSATT